MSTHACTFLAGKQPWTPWQHYCQRFLLPVPAVSIRVLVQVYLLTKNRIASCALDT